MQKRTSLPKVIELEAQLFDTSNVEIKCIAQIASNKRLELTFRILKFAELNRIVKTAVQKLRSKLKNRLLVLSRISELIK